MIWLLYFDIYETVQKLIELQMDVLPQKNMGPFQLFSLVLE